MLRTSRAAMLLVLAVAAVLQHTVSSTRLPHLRIESVDDLRGQVCYRSASNVQKALQEELTLKNLNDYPKKPSTVSVESPCYGMAASCCLPRKEEELKNKVREEYQTKLQQAFERRGQRCKITGRKFESALYINIKMSMELLREELSDIMATNISQDLIKDFSDYMYKFVYSRDFCPLNEVISDQIKKLFRFAYQIRAAEEDGLPLTANSCMSSLEDHFLSTWLNDTLQNMMQTLNSIRLISETFELVQSLITDVRRHKWSPQCVSSLFTIRYCAYCAGYENFHHCDGNCLNVLRGCTADMAELQKEVKKVTNLLLKLAKLAQSELNPVKLVRSTLIDYVLLGKHLSRFNFTDASLSNNCSINEELDQELLRQLGRTALLHINITKEGKRIPTNNILPAIQDDLSCFSDLQSLLLQLPEEMCGVNPHHLAYMRYRECWNGTDRDSYTHHIVGHYKDDQVNNPAFKDRPLPLNTTFPKTYRSVAMVTRDIHQTLDFYQCLSLDDEDCSTRFVLQCELMVPNDNLEGGSGSGSGSGMGGGYDTEKVHNSKNRDVPLVIVLGGKRKFSDQDSDDDDDDDKIFVNPQTTTLKTQLKTTTLKTSSFIPTTSSKKPFPTSSIIIMKPSKSPLYTPEEKPEGYKGEANMLSSALLIIMIMNLIAFMAVIY